MRCIRCSGLKVPDILRDGGMTVLAYRCIHCGDVIDQMILLHRKRHCPLRARKPRTPVYNDTHWKLKNSAVGHT